MVWWMININFIDINPKKLRHNIFIDFQIIFQSHLAMAMETILMTLKVKCFI
jgi:hypothetical protein